MDLPALRGFVAVAEERHFRRAAMRLHMSQPPLSARIRGLELQLGVRLFRRGPGAPVSLTPAGAALLPLAQEIVELAHAAEGAVGRVRRGELGALSVAAAPGIPGRLLGHAVRRFREAYPEVDLALCEMEVPRQLAELKDGRIDVAVIRHVGEVSCASATVIAEAELGVACAGDDALAAGDSVDPRALRDGRPILVPGTLAPACQEAIIEHCQALGLHPTSRCGVTEPDSFLEALGALFDRPAVALTPQLLSDDGGLVWRPLDGRPLILRTSALVDPSHGSAAARNFVEALTEGALVAGGRVAAEAAAFS